MRNPSHAVPMMEEEFMAAIRRCELPLMLDDATKGDGNCWVHAVIQQLERPEIMQQINARTREVMNISKLNRYLTLKSKIAEFATTSQHPNIKQAKASFQTKGQGLVEQISWEDHWKVLKKDREWSDEVMVQATAWFTGIDIHLVMSTGTLNKPFNIMKGNLDDRDKDCPGLPMWIGYINSIHYQSLLPTNEEFLAPRSCARNAKVEAQKKREKSGDRIPKKQEKQQNTINKAEEEKGKEEKEISGDRIIIKNKENNGRVQVEKRGVWSKKEKILKVRGYQQGNETR